METKETHEQHAERVRKALREARDKGRDVATIAQRADVTPAALYEFIAEGSTVRPYRRTLSQYERALSGVDETLPGNGTGATDGGANSLEQLRMLAAGLPAGVRNPDGSVTLAPETYGFVLSQLLTVATMSSGVVDQLSAASRSALAMGQAMGDTLHAIGGTVERVTSGVHGLARSGVMPSPAPPPGPSRRTMTEDEAEADTEQLRREKAVSAAVSAPARAAQTAPRVRRGA